uniref:NFATC2-interacting protein n=1 Tax=Leptobrachium leishanense TaxID=445787 RepID=A0A8C5PJY4_9ANUR
MFFIFVCTQALKESPKVLAVIDLVTKTSEGAAEEQEKPLASACPSEDTCELNDRGVLSPCPTANVLSEAASRHGSSPRYAAGSESSDSDVELVRPPRVKRRRVLHGIVPAGIPVYSNKVTNCLKLLPNDTNAFARLDEELERLQGPEDQESEVVTKTPTNVYTLSDSDEEKLSEPSDRIRDASPSPPPTPKTPKQKRGRVYRKIREVDARLKDLGTLMSPPQRANGDEADVIFLDSSPAPEVTIKVRRRGEIFRINLSTRDPLEKLVEAMSSRLKVIPSQILLLLRDEELDTAQTPRSLNLTVADIIDCMVLSRSEEPETAEDDRLCLKVQGKEKESHLSIFVGKSEPLQSLMDQYVAAKGLPQKVSFMFEGRKLKGKSTAEELGLENDDIIEVWV